MPCLLQARRGSHIVQNRTVARDLPVQLRSLVLIKVLI